MSVLELLGSVLTELEKVKEKLDRLLASKSGIYHLESTTGKREDWVEKPKKETTVTDIMVDAINTATKEEVTDFALPMTGKYQWYRFADQEGKVRACNNEGCDLFLLWNKDKNKYEHWKYDANTGKGGFVQDNCDFYGGF